MKKYLSNSDKYGWLKNKSNKIFIPNKPEVNSMNNYYAKMHQIDLENRIDTVASESTPIFPVNGIDEDSSVKVIVYVDNVAYSYFKYCENAFVNWCDNKKYKLSIVRNENRLNLHVTWNKIQLLRNALYRNTHDMVVIVDADVIINNSFLDIKQYLKPNKYIYMSSDGDNGNSVVNTGFIFAITNDYSKKFSDDVWKKRNGEYSFKQYHEQTVISQLYHQGYFDIIEVLDMRAVNSFWLDDKFNRSDNNVYHFMGRPLEEKIKYVKRHFDILE
jgi:hypothetical protein